MVMTVARKGISLEAVIKFSKVSSFSGTSLFPLKNPGILTDIPSMGAKGSQHTWL